MQRLLRPWHTLVVLTVAGTLAACEPAPPASRQEGVAAEQAPTAPSTPAPGTDAVQGLGGDAATVAASAAKAQEMEGGSAPLDTDASPLQALRVYVGSYPSDVNVSFLEQGVLAERLKHMLGKDYPTLLANMRTVGPLTQDQGRWFIVGNRPHEGGTEAAAIVVDAARDAVRVWMLHEGQAQEFQDLQGVPIDWPRDVQVLQENLRGG